jgi:hypothetical protein
MAPLRSGASKDLSRAELSMPVLSGETTHRAAESPPGNRRDARTVGLLTFLDNRLKVRGDRHLGATRRVRISYSRAGTRPAVWSGWWAGKKARESYRSAIEDWAAVKASVLGECLLETQPGDSRQRTRLGSRHTYQGELGAWSSAISFSKARARGTC